MRFKYLCLLAFALSSSLYAENPFIGKWKIDAAKSRFAGGLDWVKAEGPNTWTFEDFSFSWTLKGDGTDHPTPFGTTALKVVSPTTWQLIRKTNGRPTGTETWELAPDGKSMTRTFTGQQEDGELFKGVSVLKRIAGRTGFAGVWELTGVKMTFTEVDIAPNGDDGITLNLPGDGTHYSVKFDGKDYPEEGPRMPAGVTVSAKLAGPRKARVTTKINGKLFAHEEWGVSADGKTFTYTEDHAGWSKPVVVVLHRME